MEPNRKQNTYNSYFICWVRLGRVWPYFIPFGIMKKPVSITNIVGNAVSISSVLPYHLITRISCFHGYLFVCCRTIGLLPSHEQSLNVTQGKVLLWINWSLRGEFATGFLPAHESLYLEGIIVPRLNSVKCWWFSHSPFCPLIPMSQDHMGERYSSTVCNPSHKNSISVV